MIHEEIKNGIKDAMKSRDAVRLNVLRGLSTAFMNELVATNRTPQDTLTDEQALVVIARTAKQRKDSIKQFTDASRMDLADEDSAQLLVLETYLPKMMERSEVEKIVQDIKTNSGFNDVSKKGLFMAQVMKELKGKADGGLVKEVVDSLFI